MIAYIGPGSGLVISATFLTVAVVFFTVLAAPFLLPLSVARHVLRRRKLRFPRGFRKVVVVGLDGFDPTLVRRLMRQGKLPRLEKLAQDGHFSELATVAPAITPAAWSSFTTGAGPSFHGIFDFVSRDPATYLPR